LRFSSAWIRYNGGVLRNVHVFSRKHVMLKRKHLGSLKHRFRRMLMGKTKIQYGDKNQNRRSKYSDEGGVFRVCPPRNHGKSEDSKYT